MSRPFVLRPVSVSDQRFPCSFVTDGQECPTRASFRLVPSCIHTEEEWPTAQACATHLARVVRRAAERIMASKADLCTVPSWQITCYYPG